MSNILVNGIVSHRDKQPYIQLDIDGHMVQMSMAEARNIARDIEVMCARTEADAMIHKFFADQQFPEGANAAVMVAFREFRNKLDGEAVEKTRVDPDA
jgi:hypothetical protein